MINWTITLMQRLQIFTSADFKLAKATIYYAFLTYKIKFIT